MPSLLETLTGRQSTAGRAMPPLEADLVGLLQMLQSARGQ